MNALNPQSVPQYLNLSRSSSKANFEAGIGYLLAIGGVGVGYFGHAGVAADCIGIILMLSGYGFLTASNIRLNGLPLTVNSRLWWRGITVLRIAFVSYNFVRGNKDNN